MNTTSGHQTHTIVWQSGHGTWDITRHDTYHRSGELASRRYTLTDRRKEGGNISTSYEVNARYLDHARHMLKLAKTHQIPTPAYVCRAVLAHCQDADSEKSRQWHDNAIRFGEAM